MQIRTLEPYKKGKRHYANGMRVNMYTSGVPLTSKTRRKYYLFGERQTVFKKSRKRRHQKTKLYIMKWKAKPKKKKVKYYTSVKAYTRRAPRPRRIARPRRR